MTKSRHYSHASPNANDAKLAEDTRKIINDSLKLLKEATPDTFLGRATNKLPQRKPKGKKIT